MEHSRDQRDVNASYETRLNEAIQRMANRIGGEFIHNERWEEVVRAHSDDVVQPFNR